MSAVEKGDCSEPRPVADMDVTLCGNCFEKLRRTADGWEHFGSDVPWEPYDLTPAQQPASTGVLRGPLKVNLLVTDIGEVKEWAMDGKDDVRFSSWDEETTEVFWQVDSLPLALNLVPDLMDAIERARGRNEHVEVVVRSTNNDH